MLIAPATPSVAIADPSLENRHAKSRLAFGVISGVVAGVGLIGSMQVGAGIAFSVNAGVEWGLGYWGDHWVWRSVWSVASTYVAAFIAGMIARRRGALIGILSAIPTVLFWAFVAFAGFAENPDIEVPLGYKIAAIVLLLITLPIGSAGGSSGEGYGAANAGHFDSRAHSLFGIKWYHYLWLPFLIHFVVVQTTWAAMYGFGWITTAWRASQSIFVMFPMMFALALFGTLQLVATGSFKAYSALAGFDEGGERTRVISVLKYGFGFPLLAAVAQLGIVFVHYGIGKIFG